MKRNPFQKLADEVWSLDDGIVVEVTRSQLPQHFADMLAAGYRLFDAVPISSGTVMAGRGGRLFDQDYIFRIGWWR